MSVVCGGAGSFHFFAADTAIALTKPKWDLVLLGKNPNWPSRAPKMGRELQ